MVNFNKEIKKDTFSVKFTATESGQIIGWGYLYIIFQDRHIEPYGLLENIYVEQEYRSKGVGRQLVLAMIEEAKEQGCYKIIGTSKTSNEGAHRFYEKLGLKKMGFEFRMDLKLSQPKQQD